MKMKRTQYLIKFAEKMSKKYASIDAETIRKEVESGIKTAIINASMQNNGIIMPFAQMATQDNVAISFWVNRNGKNITAYDLNIDPPNPQAASKYQPLLGQIKTYLERYLELYPTKIYGDDVSYNNFAIHLVYPNQDDSIGNV
jgi:hypothetical protein